jgi:hypothetical protein
MVLSKKKVRLATIMDDSRFTNHKHGRSENKSIFNKIAIQSLPGLYTKAQQKHCCSPSTEGTGTFQEGRTSCYKVAQIKSMTNLTLSVTAYDLLSEGTWTSSSSGWRNQRAPR